MLGSSPGGFSAPICLGSVPASRESALPDLLRRGFRWGNISKFCLHYARYSGTRRHARAVRCGIFRKLRCCWVSPPPLVD
jgi:hypothetical protein